MGFNFQKGGPPRFQNKRKEEANKNNNHDKDLRAIIDEEKDKEYGERYNYDYNNEHY